MNNAPVATRSAGQLVGGGRYSLHVPLGDTDCVWLAQDEADQRLVVIRFFPADLRADARAMKIVKQRCEAALHFKHSHVARVLEWYEAEGVEPFVAMEYVEGQAFEQHYQTAARTAVPWSKIEGVMSEVAQSLAAMHEAGLVHHGVVPANIILTPDGARLVNPVVTGIVRCPTMVPSALSSPAALRWFGARQLAGEAPTSADDFYSFGATLYEALTGRALFQASKSILNDIRQGAIPNITDALPADSDLPLPVAEFIMACLKADPSARPTSFRPVFAQRAKPMPVTSTPVNVVPLVAEPAEVLPAVVVPTRRAGSQTRSRVPLIAAAAAITLLAVAGAGVWFATQSKKEKQELASVGEAAKKEAERLRQVAEEEKRRVAQLEETRRKESEARQRAEAELKQKEEEARVAAAELERRSIHASVLPAAQFVAVNTKTVAGPLQPSANDEGFTSLFNGRDLTDWEGESEFWSVMDGAITTQAKPTTPAHKRHYLVWKKGKVDDFELRFAYRFRVLRGNRTPNGGVVYRATSNSIPELSAYQFDVIANDAKNNGAVVEDKRRYRLAGYGESGVAKSSGKTEVSEQIGETNKLAAVRAEDWNQCVIIAKGNHLTHYINGMLVADVTDENTAKLHKNGTLALELYTKNTNNPATFLQYKDLKLKKLAKDSTLVSAK